MPLQHYSARHFAARHFKSLYQVGAAGGILAEDIASPSSVSVPVLHQVQGLLANDIASGSSVGHPVLHQVHVLDAGNITAPSRVTVPAIAVEAGAAFRPAIGTVLKPYKRRRRFNRQVWEEWEKRRREALERAEAFRGTKDRKRAVTAARATSEAIARAIEAAEEAGDAFAAGEIIRSFEAAASAARLADFLRMLEQSRLAAEEAEDEADVELLLLAS